MIDPQNRRYSGIYPEYQDRYDEIISSLGVLNGEVPKINVWGAPSASASNARSHYDACSKLYNEKYAIEKLSKTGPIFEAYAALNEGMVMPSEFD